MAGVGPDRGWMFRSGGGRGLRDVAIGLGAAKGDEVPGSAMRVM